VIESPKSLPRYSEVDATFAHDEGGAIAARLLREAIAGTLDGWAGSAKTIC